MNDPVSVLVLTVDSLAATNALVSTHGRILVHKVTLTGNGSNALTVDLYNALTVTGSAVIVLAMGSQAAGIFDRYAEANFDKPVPFDIGLTVDLTGNGGTVRIYYTPQ